MRDKKIFLLGLLAFALVCGFAGCKQPTDPAAGPLEGVWISEPTDDTLWRKFVFAGSNFVFARSSDGGSTYRSTLIGTYTGSASPFSLTVTRWREDSDWESISGPESEASLTLSGNTLTFGMFDYTRQQAGPLFSEVMP